MQLRKCYRYVLWSLLAVAGCDHQLLVCHLNALPGLVVSVKDQAQGIPLFGDPSARIIARTATFADTAPVYAAQVSLLEERPGRFAVSVEYPGYALWTRSDVLVKQDECHVRQVQLAAELVRASGATEQPGT